MEVILQYERALRRRNKTKGLVQPKDYAAERAVTRAGILGHVAQAGGCEPLLRQAWLSLLTVDGIMLLEDKSTFQAVRAVALRITLSFGGPLPSGVHLSSRAAGYSTSSKIHPWRLSEYANLSNLMRENNKCSLLLYEQLQQASRCEHLRAAGNESGAMASGCERWPRLYRREGEQPLRVPPRERAGEERWFSASHWWCVLRRRFVSTSHTGSCRVLREA
jgi:hypothetical protein